MQKGKWETLLKLVVKISLLKHNRIVKPIKWALRDLLEVESVVAIQTSFNLGVQQVLEQHKLLYKMPIEAVVLVEELQLLQTADLALQRQLNSHAICE